MAVLPLPGVPLRRPGVPPRAARPVDRERPVDAERCWAPFTGVVLLRPRAPSLLLVTAVLLLSLFARRDEDEDDEDEDTEEEEGGADGDVVGVVVALRPGVPLRRLS